MKEIKKIVRRLLREQKSTTGAALVAVAYELVQNIVTPVYRGDF